MQRTLVQEKSQRVVAFLNREEVDFLDKFGKDALFSSGIKLSRAKLIAWMVDFLKKLNINGENIVSQEELEKKIKDIIKNTTPPATERTKITCDSKEPA